MAKLVDAPDLGSGDFGRVGSSPIRRTKEEDKNTDIKSANYLPFLFLSTNCQPKYIMSIEILYKNSLESL